MHQSHETPPSDKVSLRRSNDLLNQPIQKSNSTIDLFEMVQILQTILNNTSQTEATEYFSSKNALSGLICACVARSELIPWAMQTIIVQDNVDALKAFCQANIDISKHTHDMLKSACCFGKIKIVKYLLEVIKVANINHWCATNETINNKGGHYEIQKTTPLHCAKQGKINSPDNAAYDAIIALLKKHGAQESETGTINMISLLPLDDEQAKTFECKKLIVK